MKRPIKTILKTIVYLMAVIGTLIVGLILFLKTSRLYEVHVNFNKSRIALFDEINM